MPETPAFLDLDRPDVPDVAVPRAVLPFFLPGRPVRGRLVRLGPLAEALLSRHRYPPALAGLAGEALALVGGLAGERKFRGSFSLQTKGDGPVPLLLADCTDQGELRIYLRTDETRLAALLAATPAPSAAALLGHGHLAFTVEQGAGARHQGIVAIEGESLEDMARAYFEGSVQLAGLVRLAAARGSRGWRAGALVLERIARTPAAVDDEAPLAANDADEDWRTAAALAATLRDAELLDDALPPEQLLYRLFHTEGVATDRPRPLSYGCRCTRARLSSILGSFPPADLDAMAVDGAIAMVCEFCNHEFRFSRADFGTDRAD